MPSPPLLTTVPPFATDAPDSAYRVQPSFTGRRPVQPRVVDPNDRSSAYDHYDDYTSGIGADFMNGGIDSSDEEDEDPVQQARNKHAALIAATKSEPKQVSIPVASPRPGYVEKAAILNPPVKQHSPVSPTLQNPTPPSIHRNGSRLENERDTKQQGKKSNEWADTVVEVSPAPPYSQPNLTVPSLFTKQTNSSSVSIAPSLPSNPKGLQSLQSIKPAFVKTRDSVRFNSESSTILRGGAEGMVIPRRGARGDDFWRRFSVIAKTPEGKESSWLKSTQKGSKTMSRGVWFLTVILLICIVGGIGAGWYFGHNDNSHEQPVARGGSANISGVTATVSSKSMKATSTSSALHVSPTNTVARRHDSHSSKRIKRNNRLI